MALPFRQSWWSVSTRRRQWGLEQVLPITALAHGFARRIIQYRPAPSLFPAATHGLVKGNQVLRQVATRGDQKVLLAK
jgi:hypothetical protein